MPKNNDGSTATLTADIQQFRNEMNEAQRIIKETNKTFAAETSGFDDWAKDSDMLKKKLESLDKVLKSQKTLLNGYDKDLKEAKEAHEKAAAAVDEERAKLQDLKNKGIDPNNKAYKDQEKALITAMKAQDKASGELSKANIRYQEQVGAINKTEAEIKKYAKAQEDVAKSGKSIAQTVKDQEKELKSLKKEYVDTSASQGKTSDAAKELAKKIEDLSAELQKNKDAMDKAQKEADELDHSYSGAGKAAKDAAKEADESSGVWKRAWDDILGVLTANVVTKSFDMMVSGLKKVGSAMADAVKNGAAFADNIITLSSVTGLGTETLQEFQYMEDLIDVSTGTIAKSFAKLKKSMQSASRGTKATQESFEKLGVNIQNADGSLRDAEDVFNDAIDALGKMENETERDAVAMDLFGRSATELNPLIEAGSEALEGFRKEAHDVGYVLDGATLSSLGRTQDALDRLNKRTEGVKNSFATGLAPAAEKFYSALDSALASPKTQEAIRALSEGIGNLIGFFADLATVGIPAFVDAFGIFDSKIRNFSENELAVMHSIDDMSRSHQGLADQFKDNAGAILDETQRTTDLWKELQTLADENGKVDDKNHDRANYILGQLSEALGKEYRLNGDIIESYQTMREEVGKLIKQKELEALLSADTEAYTQALKENAEARRNVTLQSETLAQKEAELAEVTAELDEMNRQLADGVLHFDEDDTTYEKLKQKVIDVQGAYDEANESLEAARRNYAETSETIQRHNDALEAQANGNYQKGVEILTQSIGGYANYYKQKQQMSEEDLAAWKRELDLQKKDIDLYHAELEKGTANHNAAELKAMQEAWWKERGLWGQAKKESLEIAKETGEGIPKETAKGISRTIGDVKTSSKAIGEAVGDGVKSGINAKAGEIATAGKAAVNAAIKAMRTTAQIASPSKVTEEMGEFLDLGMAQGIIKKISAVKKAAASMTSATTQAMQMKIPEIKGGVQAVPGSATTNNNFTQNIYAPKTPSRIELYRDSKNLLEMAGGI